MIKQGDRAQKNYRRSETLPLDNVKWSSSSYLNFLSLQSHDITEKNNGIRL